MDWFRWHHGTVADPKFKWVAVKSGQSVAGVLAIWSCLLERASQEDQRGYITGFDFESYDIALGLDDGTCQIVYEQMELKGLILNGCIVSWSKRQLKYEDPTAAERKRAQRKREKDQEKSQLVTVDNERSQNVTECHDRLDKKREEKESKNILPTKMPSASSSKTKTADPKHTWFTRWWCWSFERITGDTYAYTAADAGIISKLLKSPGFSPLLERSCHYLLIPEEQRWPRGSPTLKGLALNINQFAACYTADTENKSRKLGLLPPSESIILSKYTPWAEKDAAWKSKT